MHGQACRLGAVVVVGGGQGGDECEKCGKGKTILSLNHPLGPPRLLTHDSAALIDELRKKRRAATMLRATSAEKKQRAARFSSAEGGTIPDPPVKKMAHQDVAIKVKGSQTALVDLCRRRIANGEALTPSQEEALTRAGLSAETLRAEVERAPPSSSTSAPAVYAESGVIAVLPQPKAAREPKKGAPAAAPAAGRGSRAAGGLAAPEEVPPPAAPEADRKAAGKKRKQGDGAVDAASAAGTAAAAKKGKAGAGPATGAKGAKGGAAPKSTAAADEKMEEEEEKDEEDEGMGAAGGVAGANARDEKAVRVRALKKKLRQIEALEERGALSEAQQAKLARKEELLAELEGLSG
jgi:hypothetical protein